VLRGSGLIAAIRSYPHERRRRRGLALISIVGKTRSVHCNYELVPDATAGSMLLARVAIATTIVSDRQTSAPLACPDRI